MADVMRTGDQPTGIEPAVGPPFDLTRRGFLSATTLALLGIAVGWEALAPDTLLALTRELTAAPVWRPLSALATVSVATDGSAKSYPGLVPGSAFDDSRAVHLLENALAGLSGTTAVDAISAVVASGGTVLVKPNWVEPLKWSKGKITHPALVLAVARLAAEAVGPTGHVIIAEGTSEGRDLPKILSATTFMRALHDFGLDAPTATRAAVKVVDLNSAAAGSVAVKLGKLSRFAGVRDKLYDASGRAIGHPGQYRIARPIINADLVIDFAKAKVHCSAGVTLTLKNFVGIVPTGHDATGHYRLKTVPHYSAADAHNGRTYVRNRTIGGTSADLHAAALYVARNGALTRTHQRKLLCIVDGVVSGQTTQFNPQPKATGWVAAGYDPVAVDHVATRCMGFDPALVVSIKPAAKGTLKLGTGAPADVRIVYQGSSSFAGYFTAGRALRPESVVAKWGKAISLKTRSIAAPAVSFSGGNVIVKPRHSGQTARLYAGSDFVTMARQGNGSFIAPLPTGPDPVRLAMMDTHFNVWERGIVG